MSGKHRMTPEPDRSLAAEATGGTLRSSRVASAGASGSAEALKKSAKGLLFPASIAVAFAGFSAAVVVAHSEPEVVAEAPTTASAESTAFTESAAFAQSLTQQGSLTQHGVVVAVGPDSITTRSADGRTQTFRVTPDTAAVTSAGGQTFAATTPFAVDDQVAVQATVSSGLPTATAVADRAVIGQNGVPMDSM